MKATCKNCNNQYLMFISKNGRGMSAKDYKCPRCRSARKETEAPVADKPFTGKTLKAKTTAPLADYKDRKIIPENTEVELEDHGEEYRVKGHFIVIPKNLAKHYLYELSDKTKNQKDVSGDTAPDKKALSKV